MLTLAPPLAGTLRIFGYASVFNAPDRGGDVVLPGAFALSLRSRSPDRVRMLFNHAPALAIGEWTEIVETDHGLRVDGVFDRASFPDLCRRIERRRLTGLSIGFRTLRASRSGRWRTLREVDLWEVSLVSRPVQSAASIIGFRVEEGGA